MSDKGEPIPVFLQKRKESDTSPIEVQVQKSQKPTVIQQEHVSLDKIVQSSESSFYITGKTTKIGLLNFLNLLDKHELNEIEGLEKEEVVVSSQLITEIASAEVADEDEDNLKYIDSFAIGVFVASFGVSLFMIFAAQIQDIRAFSWILLLLSVAFLGHYTYKGIRSGELEKVTKAVIKSLSKK
jgi:hypothetical protein